MSRKAKQFKPELYIAAINTFIDENPVFQGSNFRSLLKSIGMPSNSTFWSVLTSKTFIHKLDIDTYQFELTKPLYTDGLTRIYEEYRTRVNGYAQKRRQSVRQKHPLEREDIQAAIKLLNDAGFDVVVSTSKLKSIL